GARVLAGDLVLAQPGVLEGQRGSDQRELDEAVETPGVSALDVGRHVDVHLAGDLHAQLGGVEAGDVADAVPRLVLPGEELGGADPDRSDGADPGDDDTSHDGCKGTRPRLWGLYPGLTVLLLVGDELDGVADGADALGFLVRDLHAELVLQAHDQLHDVERVGAQVLLEAGLRRDLAGVGIVLVGDDVSDLLEDLLLVHCVLPPGRSWSRTVGSLPGPGGLCPRLPPHGRPAGRRPRARGAYKGPRIITA